MKKAFYIILVFLFCVTNSSCIYNPESTPQSLFGDIAFNIHKENSYAAETIMLDLESGETQTLNTYSSAVYLPIHLSNENILLAIGASQVPYAGYAIKFDLGTSAIEVCQAFNYQGIVDDSSSEDPYDVISFVGYEVYAMDLRTCSKNTLLYDDIEAKTEGTGSRAIIGAVVDPTGKYLYFGSMPDATEGENAPTELRRLEIENNEMILIAEGFGPSISHDGKSLAFVVDDGIMLLDLSTGVTERIVEFPHVSRNAPPVIQWSLDDQRLLYHYLPVDFSQERALIAEIYILDLRNGEVTILSQHGIFPVWLR